MKNQAQMGREYFQIIYLLNNIYRTLKTLTKKPGKILNKQFMTKDIWMTTKDMKSCSTLLVIRKTLTKSIIVSNYKSIRMIKIKKSYHTKFEKRCENSETL